MLELLRRQHDRRERTNSVLAQTVPQIAKQAGSLALTPAICYTHNLLHVRNVSPLAISHLRCHVRCQTVRCRWHFACGNLNYIWNLHACLTQACALLPRLRGVAALRAPPLVASPVHRCACVRTGEAHENKAIRPSASRASPPTPQPPRPSSSPPPRMRLTLKRQPTSKHPQLSGCPCRPRRTRRDVRPSGRQSH